MKQISVGPYTMLPMVRLTDHMLTYIQVNESFALDGHMTVHRFTPVVAHCVENGYITPCTCAQDMATEGG